MITRAAVKAALALVALTTPACIRVRPHERQLLAHPALAQPAWPDAAAAQAHVYQVREGSEGAVGAGGGGCGCN